MGGERAVAVAAAAAVVVRRPEVVIQLSAAKQSNRIHLVPQRLRRAITNYLRSCGSSSDQIQNNNEPLPPQISGDDDDDPAVQDNKRRRSNNGRMIRRKREILMRLARNFNEIKGNNFQLSAAAASSSSSHQLIDSSSSYFNNNNNNSRAQRWKLDTKFGDSGLHYDDDQTAVYVAARMPSVYSACHRVLQEVRRRLVGFSPKRVLDFGSGSGAALWAVREVWPQDVVEQVNTVEPSKAMLRASVNLLQHEQGLPIIQSYESIQSLNKKLKKSERQHDLVIASYVLGEIPSLKDRTTIVRQLWALTSDVLVLIEPGTPVGFSIISHMRSYVLWMSNRRQKKSSTDQTSHSVHEEQSYEETLPSEKIIGAKYGGAFVVSPCPHDGACPLEKAGKYCHFVQRMERTPTQRAFKKTSKKALRGFEDEKFSFVVIRRGERPREPWPLDGLHFETLKEQRERHNKEDVDIDCEDLIIAQDEELKQPQADLSGDDSDHSDTNHIDASFEDGVEEAALPPADLGSGWGRIIFPPVRRGRRVCLDVCRSTKRDGSKGCLERLVVTRTDSPILHNQARKSIWGDLWPF